MEPRKRLNHEAPYLVTSDADYFVTLCAEPRKKHHFCHRDIGQAMLDAAKIYNDRQIWWCHLILLMPDHVHMLVCFPPEKIMSNVVGLGNASWRGSLELRGNEIISITESATREAILANRSTS